MEAVKVFDSVQKKYEEKYAGDAFAYAGFAIAKHTLLPIAMAVEECKSQGRPLNYELRMEFSRALTYPAGQDFPAEMKAPMKLMGRLFQRQYGHLAHENN